MASLFLITFDNRKLIDTLPFHQTILNLPGISDWWHYIPGTYLVVAETDVNEITRYINLKHSTLKFLVIKTDLENSNGVLQPEAWDWIKERSSPLLRLLKIKPVTKLKIVPGLSNIKK